jgi:mgtE-like transporter
VKTPTPDRASRENASRAQLALRPARAALRPARAAGHGLREIFRYWSAERRTIRQGFMGLWISSLGDLVAGLALASMTHRLDLLPGLFILVPAAIGMRGNIFGAFGSRLGTAIHEGRFKVTRSRTGVLYQNAYASILLSVITAGFLATAARIVSAATGLGSISIWDFVAISVIAGVLSSAVVLTLTVLLALVGYKRDWDLDSIAAPVVTFMGDTITLPALFGASFIARRGKVTLVVGVVLAVACVWSLVGALRTNLPAARRIMRESLLVLMLAGVVDIFAGTIIEHRFERFIGLPALLVLIPPFLEDAGSLGSIVSARLASKLHMGSIEPRLLPQRLALLDVTLLAPFALSVFTLVGISANLIAHAFHQQTPGLLRMVEISVIAGYIATMGAAVIAYAAACATFRFGLDPDNHGVPLVTSSMDFIGVVALVGTIVLLGVR